MACTCSLLRGPNTFFEMLLRPRLLRAASKALSSARERCAAAAEAEPGRMPAASFARCTTCRCASDLAMPNAIPGGLTATGLLLLPLVVVVGSL